MKLMKEVFLLSTPTSQLLAGICWGLQWKSSTASMAKYHKMDFSCMRVTRHRLVHLPCVIMRERSLKHWVYSWPLHQIFIASLLMLRDVLEAIAPLNLVLQTGNEQLCLIDVKTSVHLIRSKLENLRTGETKWFKEESFDDMVCKAQQQRLSLPPNARLGSVDTSFGWERYVTDVRRCAVRRCIWAARILDGFWHFGSL